MKLATKGSFLLAMGLLVGCGDRAPGETSEAQASISVDYQLASTGREYRLFTPSGYHGQPLPLVFMLDGFGRSGLDFGNSSGMEAVGEAETFFVATLLGTECDPNLEDGACTLGGPNNDYPRGWNNGITVGTGILVDDVQYVRDVLDDIINNPSHPHKVNTHRVYAAGKSNGAMMAYRLAAEMPDVLAAIGAVSGALGLRYKCDPYCLTDADGVAPWDCACNVNPYSTTCETYRIGKTKSTAPISVGIVHGTADNHLWENGTVDHHPPGLHPIPLSEAVDFWTDVNHCTGKPTVDEAGGVERTRYAWCAKHTEVVLFRVDGMGHIWPGASDGFAASSALWGMFKRHHN